MSLSSVSQIGLKSLITLIFVLIFSCGANKKLTGIWQQELDDQSTELPTFLYEIHLAQFGAKVTGLLLRYRTPSSQDLSLFDRADRCNCYYIIQGSYNDDLSKVVFSILEPTVNRNTDTNPSCVPTAQEVECERIWELTDIDGILEGETWCVDQPQMRSAIRLISTPGVTLKECLPIDDQTQTQELLGVSK